jgi:hypothetical protein
MQGPRGAEETELKTNLPLLPRILSSGGFRGEWLFVFIFLEVYLLMSSNMVQIFKLTISHSNAVRYVCTEGLTNAFRSGVFPRLPPQFQGPAKIPNPDYRAAAQSWCDALEKQLLGRVGDRLKTASA